MTQRSYIFPRHLVVTEDVARYVHALLRDGRLNARRSGIVLNPSITQWLLDLDGLIGAAHDVVPEEPAWLTTAQVRVMFGHGSDNATRQLGNRLGWHKRKVRGVLYWLEADVLAELAARAEANEHKQTQSVRPSEQVGRLIA